MLEMRLFDLAKRVDPHTERDVMYTVSITRTSFWLVVFFLLALAL